MKTARARGAMPKHQVFLVVFIGIWEPFRPGAPLSAKMVEFSENHNFFLNFVKFMNFHDFPPILVFWGPWTPKITKCQV